MSQFSVCAPAGIPEVGSGAPLAKLIIEACLAPPVDGLSDGDIVVVTSKIISKAEGRVAPRGEREGLIRGETVHTLARRGPTKIVRTRIGLTIAAAGVDNSNVAVDSVLALPLDPDTSATNLRAELTSMTGRRLAVIISDTAGRTWREGQIDQAIGASGVEVAHDYGGTTDDYGNDLIITRTAFADELAAAADLVKGKVAGRPVAVIRGLGHLVTDSGQRAADLVRPPSGDLFGYGAQEAVLAAALAVTGLADRYEELVDAEPAERIDAVLAATDLPTGAAELLTQLLSVDLREIGPGAN